MELPSSRELELEILLREKDVQLAEVTDEITALRRYLSKQPGPSTTDAVTLPPALVSVLLPHITSGATPSTSSSSTVTAALTQRARLLQEENDELYELLKHSETGKLKDEVRGLRRVVAKLEGALKESHQVIDSLSTELDKAYQTLKSTSRKVGSTNKSNSHSHSPQDMYHSVSNADSMGNGHGASKLPPTGPRGHKRPRLSESHVSPAPRLAPSLPQKPPPHHHNSHHHLPSRVDTRDQGRHAMDNRPPKLNVKMEVDDDERAVSPPSRERDRNREPRERNNRDRERDRERGVKERDRPPHTGKDWDRDGGKYPNPRRNGHNSGPSGRGPSNGATPGRKGNDRSNPNTNNHISDQGSRTLQERLGL